MYINDSRRKFGNFARSVRVELVLNCYTLSQCCLHCYFSGIRILLLGIEGSIRNV